MPLTNEVASSSTSGKMSVKEALCIASKVFEGNKKDLREFIKNVDAAFELVKPEEHETLLKFVKAKITGEARSRLQVRERTGTWQEVKRVLEENYASKRTIDYYACKIFQARQGQGEPIAMWASRIDEMQRDFREAVNRVTARENLRGAIELVDSLGRACFIQGLSNDRIQTIVRSRGDEITLAAAVELALQEESAILSMKERGLAPRVKRINTTAYHPESNGALERSHRTIVEYLRHFVTGDQSSWDKWEPYAIFVFNTTPHSSTGYTPFELMYGRKVNIPGVLQQETPQVWHSSGK
ncbi:uncharacterized protein LOC124556409 [Schistocerca americana]|uniref:uncharacterized protein LOC124556409 n=1 Tax=Schistocerca americana TaxID=7009 RepID=UPI001F4F6C32|nr:uncharacterized protein LOC124556409 [Schistocerca americana]